MPNSDAFALRQSGLNEFLFAPVGTEANGMTLSLVSVFARLGNDPWLEAHKLAGLPKSEATESLARIITSMSTTIWPLPVAMAIAARLITLLPTPSGQPRRNPLASTRSVNAGTFLKVALVLLGLACALAFEGGVFTTSDSSPAPDASGVASLAATPH
jgi:hypothetical protein